MKKLIRGRWVYGVKPFTKKQVLKVYWALFAWVLFTIYLIIASFFWDLYLIDGQQYIVIGIFIIVVILTTTEFRRQQRNNYIYDNPSGK